MGFLDYSGVTKATSYFKTKFAALVNGVVAIAQGGTGASTAANARVNLGTPASSSLATVESSTATVNHSKGSHFIVDGELKKATAAIASGESITSSNSTTDTLQGQIDTLQDSVARSYSTTLIGGITLVRKGHVVTVGGYTDSTAITNGVSIVNIPAQYRPAANVSGLAHIPSQSAHAPWTVSAGGNIVLYATVTSTQRVNFSAISWGI